MNFTALKAQSNVRRCWSKTAGLRTRQVLEGTSKPAVLSCNVYLFNSTVLPDAFCKIEFFSKRYIETGLIPGNFPLLSVGETARH